MNYNKWNTLLGWLTFLVASIVYLVTIEDTVSLWDCGEYITAAYKLEVGHPPGAPLFMVLGRVFSFFAAPESVAFYINSLSAISSSLTILFMFWSLTLLLKKIVAKKVSDISTGEQIAIFVAAAIGSLAYTFSDSFWFSAVEGEVYAMASLFTAVIFWAMLKWDEEMALVQNGELSIEVRPNRWLLLILFLLNIVNKFIAKITQIHLSQGKDPSKMSITWSLNKNNFFTKTYVLYGLSENNLNLDENGYFTANGFKTLVSNAAEEGISRKEFIEQYGSYLSPDGLANYGLTQKERMTLSGL
jgi:hypothetical protein